MIAISYFIVPTAIFLTLVKLNNKHRWLTARIRGSDYWTKNGTAIDRNEFRFGVAIFFVLWWIVIPMMVVSFGISCLIKWITNGDGWIPISDDNRRKNDPYR